MASACVASFALLVSVAQAENPWVVYEGNAGPGKGKHVVLVSGDEEYRSEEALPMLGMILAKQHGFKCTVLFAIDPKDGTINPNTGNNIPGLEALQTADLMVIATRFRNLPDEQMKFIVDYIEAGKPVIGLRTATHAFNIPKDRTYAKYSWNTGTPGYEKGFGRQVLGETWVSHWGRHKSEATRGVIDSAAKDLPIMRGVEGIFGDTDVYEASPPDDAKILVRGQVLKGMKPEDEPASYPKKKSGSKTEQDVNDPMMPVAWTKSYKGEKGAESRVFCTTMGSATDLAHEGTRRLVVNACFWAMGLEGQIPSKTNVDIIGEFQPTMYGFNGAKKGMKPSDYAMK